MSSKFLFVLCLFLLGCYFATEARSISDVDMNALEKLNEQIRVKRTVIHTTHCAHHEIRRMGICVSCKQLGAIHHRQLKFCNGRCIHVRKTCVESKH